MNWKLATVLAALSLFVILSLHAPAPADLKKLCLRESCVKVEVADDDAERQRGLMYRENLPSDSGMLFVFETEDMHPFWMKNTLIPLDIIWLGSDMAVVHVEHAVPCKADPCPLYVPRRKAKYVLEVDGGYADVRGVVVGDRAVWR